MTAKAAELRSAGVDVINLSVGEPDFPTPENIRLAGKQAIDDGHTRYTPGGGTMNLKSAVVEKLGISALRIGPEIDPGVPWCETLNQPSMALALKSGNFGEEDFFTKAFEMLP